MKRDDRIATVNRVRAVIMFNGEQNTWEAWEEGGEDPFLISATDELSTALREFFNTDNCQMFESFDVVEIHPEVKTYDTDR